MKTARGKRGRPPTFGRPGQVVALTLPEEVVAGLRRIDAEVARLQVRRWRHDRGLRFHTRAIIEVEDESVGGCRV